jgi:2-dehydro-3-deoxyphosphooctonate aldolase (KDO 8-P synthase)
MQTSFFKKNQKPGEQRERLFFIAGPCVIESEELCCKVAERLAALRTRYDLDLVFKASYDKANRLSASSFRGPGREGGLKILEKIRKEFGLPVLTDIHETAQAAEVADVVDVIQIPALLSRQTDLLVAAGKTGRWVNIKKGQFMAPEDMEFAMKKAGEKVWLTERGTFFGYKRLVVDFAGIPIMRRFGAPVIFDATHSVQLPGGGGGVSGGNRDLALPLARAAIAMGADGLFFEVHPDPDHALCDGPNSLRLEDFEREAPRMVAMFERVRDEG